MIARMFIKWYIRKKLCRLIVKCFDGVNWDRQHFILNGQNIEDSSGEKIFYKASEMDKFVKKLNKLISRLEKI